jgi:transposase
MKEQRKHYTPEEKVAILRRHLVEKVPISELCDKQGLQPTVFYRWQKELFENGAAAFQPKARPNHSAEQERIDYLEKKIQTKDEVLAELMAEHVAPKKRLEKSDRGLGSARYAGPDRGFRPAPSGSSGGSTSPPASSTAWRERYGKVNEHNGWVPRDFWLASAGDPCREGSEVGGGAKTAADSSAAGCVKNEEAQSPGGRSTG